jgi:uncharacterized lipoprotein YajG
MKTLLLPLVGLLLVAGCGPSSATATKPTNAPAAGDNPANAPADYLGGLAKAQKSAVRVVDTTSLNQAIQLFNVQEGRFPKDLNELVTEQYLPRIPEPPAGMKITYDAVKGQVKVVPKQ